MGGIAWRCRGRRERLPNSAEAVHRLQEPPFRQLSACGQCQNCLVVVRGKDICWNNFFLYLNHKTIEPFAEIAFLHTPLGYIVCCGNNISIYAIIIKVLLFLQAAQ